MFKTATSRLRALKGRTGIRGLARFSTLGEVSSPAAVAARPSWSPLGGFFGWLTGGRSRSMPPLDFPLQGVKFPPALPDYVQPEKPKITTLPNGVKVASMKSEIPTASIGLYINCGSVYETPESSGGSHLLERMAFKSTSNRSHLRIVREVEAIGGTVQASASREQMSYTISSLKTYVPEMVELLLDSVRNPVFLDWEVKEELLRVKDDINKASKNPEALVLEAVHCVGYKGGLANPLLAQESSISSLNSETLEEFVTENYTAPRMVLAAYGVEHEELLKIAEPLLSDLPSVPLAEEPTSVYTGGDYRCQAESGDTHFALAFELPGGWLRMKDAMILNVLQMLMGGGESFSSGGPGKGMNSRLYIHVLAQNPEVKSISAINSIYNNSAIFGIQASASSDYVAEAIDIAADELVALATPGEVDVVQLDRAKQSTKSSILMHMESRMVVVDDIGKQILTYNDWKLEQLMKAVDEVSMEDITSTTQKLLSTPLTMASYGDVTKVPRYDLVSQKFSLPNKKTKSAKKIT
ncbi:PREDICTED: mitochondrial-processing peptidase subunit alpha-like [Fragaria vesca subsp. vesca]|uniref:mitochondrial-processing peptidase subunit alpha-like n=1 Tax=Fragaria vesca subsp. vesca TaxID=101020 RepID=UPI0002C3001C|nr:PREDICTED: mitochondrial-processing peptidase subunit alpha-like [Fragaria vesca subsp. vesca]